MARTERPAPTAAEIADRYARQEAILRDEAEELNAALGLAADAPHRPGACGALSCRNGDLQVACSGLASGSDAELK